MLQDLRIHHLESTVGLVRVLSDQLNARPRNVYFKGREMILDMFDMPGLHVLLSNDTVKACLADR